MFEKELLIWQLTDRGLGSEITTMILAQLYCLDKGIEFSLCSRYWNAAYQRGWTDYFVPFCKEISTPQLKISYLFKSGGGLNTLTRFRKKLLLALRTRQRVILNYDIWAQIWNAAFVARNFQLPTLGIRDADCLTACQALLDGVWKFNGRTCASVQAMRKDLGLTDGTYFTLHVRRGDKWHEAKPINLREYIAKADAVNRLHFRKCFVMTDDYSVVTNLQRNYPQLDIVSLCEPVERGHVQDAFNARSAEARRDSMLRLLAELAIAKDGAFFVGTFSSSLGRLVAMLRGRDNTFGADFPFTMLY
jgi:hypothetical protein